jgi:phosphoribosyl 1,2-cyclic phosphodiesterase
VEGVPFFAPFFIEGSKVDVYCGKLDGSEDTKDTVLNLMRRPYFPVGPNVFTADVRYINLNENEGFSIGDDITVKTMPLNHPGGATAYRLDCNGKSFACITDTEHTVGKIDEAIVEFISGVDAFIYDCSLTDEEYPDFAGYGHSTYEEGLRLQEASGAGALIAYHHMPFRSDYELDDIEIMLKKQNSHNVIGREGSGLKI